MVLGAFVLSVANANTSSRGRGITTEADVEMLVMESKLARDRPPGPAMSLTAVMVARLSPISMAPIGGFVV